MRKSMTVTAPFDLLTDFVKCRASMSRLVAKIVKPQDIDDILQETFIRVCAASDRTEIQNPRSFMLKTAQNLALNHVSTAYQKRTRLEDFASSDVCPVTESLEAEFESKERFLGLCRAVRTLPPQCRRVFVLRKVYGLTQKEIAEHLGISESTVEKHVAKGLLMCREFMLELGQLGHAASSRTDTIGRKRSKHG